MILMVLGVAALAGLIFGPQMWIRQTMRRHAKERADFPGTGGELARHLLDEAGLGEIQVEAIDGGDHYSPVEKTVRLNKSNFAGRSVTAEPALDSGAVATRPTTRRRPAVGRGRLRSAP